MITATVGSSRGSTRSIRARRVRATDAGHTLLDVLFAAALMASLGVPALAMLHTGLERHRTEAAARFVVSRVEESRALAIRSQRSVGLRFEPASGSQRFELVMDGNGNGLRSDELTRGIDLRLTAPMRLNDYMPETVFGIGETMPGIDGDSTLERGGSPIRLGPSYLLSFSPAGTSSSGTVYVLGRQGEQYAVRVLGATGRVRLLRFDARRRAWDVR
jgi:hypothetical protein